MCFGDHRFGSDSLWLIDGQVIENVSEYYGFDLKTPFKKLLAKIRKIIVHGSGEEEVLFYKERKEGRGSEGQRGEERKKIITQKRTWINRCLRFCFSRYENWRNC